MPEIQYKGQKIACEKGDNLRLTLMRRKASPYNGAATWLNCKGFGSCGTCAVKIQGEVSPITFMEKWRLAFPPHKRSNGLRLACQVKVLGDLKIEKGKGFWGQHPL